MKNRIIVITIYGLLFFIAACKTSIKGTITQSFGNLMPSPDAPISKAIAMQTTIAFCEPVLYNGENETNGIYKELPSKLIKKTTSNNKGIYKINLPQGKYSVFVKIAEGWYAREVIDGYINLVVIAYEEQLVRDINVKYKTTQ